jgi:HSF-type DNA-binding
VESLREEITSKRVASDAATAAAKARERVAQRSQITSLGSTTVVGIRRGRIKRHKPRRNTFPSKLHFMLEQAQARGFAAIVSWQPHGRSFKIHNKTRFAQEILPHYFARQTIFTSFIRQLSSYNILRLVSAGPDQGGYYHELLLRGKLLISLDCVAAGTVAAAGTEEQCNYSRRYDRTTEPNLGDMAPMPPDDTAVHAVPAKVIQPCPRPPDIVLPRSGNTAGNGHGQQQLPTTAVEPPPPPPPQLQQPPYHHMFHSNANPLAVLPNWNFGSAYHGPFSPSYAIVPLNGPAAAQQYANMVMGHSNGWPLVMVQGNYVSPVMPMGPMGLMVPNPMGPVMPNFFAGIPPAASATPVPAAAASPQCLAAQQFFAAYNHLAQLHSSLPPRHTTAENSPPGAAPCSGPAETLLAPAVTSSTATVDDTVDRDDEESSASESAAASAAANNNDTEDDSDDDGVDNSRPMEASTTLAKTNENVHETDDEETSIDDMAASLAREFFGTTNDQAHSSRKRPKHSPWT